MNSLKLSKFIWINTLFIILSNDSYFDPESSTSIFTIVILYSILLNFQQNIIVKLVRFSTCSLIHLFNSSFNLSTFVSFVTKLLIIAFFKKLFVYLWIFMFLNIFSYFRMAYFTFSHLLSSNWIIIVKYDLNISKLRTNINIRKVYPSKTRNIFENTIIWMEECNICRSKMKKQNENKHEQSKKHQNFSNLIINK